MPTAHEADHSNGDIGEAEIAVVENWGQWCRIVRAGLPLACAVSACSQISPHQRLAERLSPGQRRRPIEPDRDETSHQDRRTRKTALKTLRGGYS